MKILNITKPLNDQPLPTGPEQSPLSQLVQEMAASGKFSAKTIENYQRAVRQFKGFMGHEVKAAAVTNAMLESFRANILRNRSPKTAQCAADAVASVVKYANPELLEGRYRGNVRELFHIRLDIADSGRADHPERLEKVLRALMKAVTEAATEGGAT